MTWNHRVIRNRSEGGEEWLALHEVYYNESGEPDMVTQEPIVVIGQDLRELRQTLKRMIKALENPILDYESFPKSEISTAGDLG